MTPENEADCLDNLARLRAEIERLKHQAVHCGECGCEGWQWSESQKKPIPCPECNPKGLPPRD